MNVRKFISFIFLIIAISFGISLTMKANIGVDAWNALAQSGSAITSIQVGTVLMVLNFLCVFIQLLILKKEFKFKHLLQIPLSILIGYLVNYFYYDLLGSLVIEEYFMRIVFYICGNLINAFVVSEIMILDVVTFALEGACKAISDRYQFSFSKFRQFVDVVSIIIVLLLSVTLNIELYVREGTILGMLTFGPMIGIFTKLLGESK